MKYIVYLTTNKINQKIYIGVHGQEDPEIFDGYLGEGAYINKPSSYNKNKCHFHNALLKHGVSNFHRKTLKVFDNLEDALDLEAWLVTEEFVKRPDTYNMTTGGQIPPLHNKTVYQFDLKGNFIDKWSSIIAVSKQFNCDRQRISVAICDRRSFNDFFWSFDQQINVDQYRISFRGCVHQYNRDGKFLNSFKNASEAALQLDIPREAIVNSVYDRVTCNGYYFLSSKDNIEELLAQKSNKINAELTHVYRYTISGTYDKEYSSVKDAAIEVGGNHGNIIRAIKKNRNAYGYKWSYVKSNTIQEYSQIDLAPVKIAQYDKDHNLIKIWDSITECKKEFPSCQKVCRKERKTSKGFIFEYIS